MPRYIDADVLEKEGWTLNRTYSQDSNTMVYEIKKLSDFPTENVVDKEWYDRLLENSTIIAEALNKYQTADVVEVVRCKDCTHCDCSIDGMGFFYCDFDEGRTVSPNGFCNVAERRKETEDE